MTTFLLIHGACHGGWCWDAVGDELARLGHAVVAPDLPCDDLGAGLAAYADVAEAALGPVEGDLVVVGHSLGALTAAVVTSRRPVRRLVFVAGVIGLPGRALSELAELDADRDGDLEPGDTETDEAGRFRFTEAGGLGALYHDCPPEVALDACRRLRFQRSMWTEVAPFDAWPVADTASIVCADDRIVRPAWSRRVARERLGIEPIELPGSHSPMLSRPLELATALAAGL